MCYWCFVAAAVALIVVGVVVVVFVVNDVVVYTNRSGTVCSFQVRILPL